MLVLLNGGAISGSFYMALPAVLEAYYPGALGGQAIAEVLFGEHSPAGRLPYNIVQRQEDLPYNYYSMAMNEAPGRTYRYFTGEPGFAFGFGLSYSKFKYSDVKAHYDKDGTLTVTGVVTNTGEMTSDEVVLVFLKSDDQGSGTTVEGAPLTSLVAFDRLNGISAGNAKAFHVTASARALQAAGLHETASASVLHVGGRAPGSAGVWADAATLPAAPEKVSVSQGKSALV